MNLGVGNGRGVAVASIFLFGALLAGGCSGSGTPESPFQAASQSATSSPSPAPASTATTTGAGGSITIGVPSPSPVVCSPAPLTVSVTQRAILNCTAQGYIGSFSAAVADPSIASVQLAAGTETFFYVSGLAAGTTTLSLSYPPDGAGSVTITVTQ